MSAATWRDLVGVGQRAADLPVPGFEELDRKVEGVRLDVLRQRDHHRAGVGGAGQHPHRLRQRGEQLLRAGDPVEEPRHRPERVVDGGVGLAGVFELLQHRALVPGGVGVSGQQQQRQPVDRRQTGGGDQVQGARADRRGHREGGAATGGLGVGGGDVRDVLLVAALDERQLVGQLIEGLTQSGDVSVSEDAQRGGHQAAPGTVGEAVLGGEVFDDGLGGGEPDRLV